MDNGKYELIRIRIPGTSELRPPPFVLRTAAFDFELVAAAVVDDDAAAAAAEVATV